MDDRAAIADSDVNDPKWTSLSISCCSSEDGLNHYPGELSSGARGVSWQFRKQAPVAGLGCRSRSASRIGATIHRSRAGLEQK
jgi:hypothetical protein